MAAVIAFPFRLLWGLTSWIFNVLGRLLATVLGVALMIVGIVLTLTIVGAPLGIPLALVGTLLVLKGI